MMLLESNGTYLAGHSSHPFEESRRASTEPAAGTKRESVSRFSMRGDRAGQGIRAAARILALTIGLAQNNLLRRRGVTPDSIHRCPGATSSTLLGTRVAGSNQRAPRLRGSIQHPMRCRASREVCWRVPTGCREAAGHAVRAAEPVGGPLSAPPDSQGHRALPSRSVAFEDWHPAVTSVHGAHRPSLVRKRPRSPAARKRRRG